ncbi:MAG: type II toxin-antitoxin system Phd/YefM family antitoxin [Pseudomonadota bacterium]
MTNMNRRVDPKSLHPAEWSVAEAKARFSEVVARAKAGEPQRVTRYGKDEVVIVSVAAWQVRVQGNAGRTESEPTLYDIFEPLIGSGVVIERMSGGFREPPFGHDD